jgi:hypothetical protein
VTWSANGEPDLGGYRVHRATAAGGPWTPISGTITATQFDDPAPPTGAGRAWYAVTALDVSDNESARSASASVVFPPPAGGAPVAWAIQTGYPNPSALGSSVTIPVAVPPEGGDAVLEIVDSAGRTVRRVDLAGLAPGWQNVSWDGRNDAGRDVAPGAYTAWLLASGSRLHMRMVRVP